MNQRPRKTEKLNSKNKVQISDLKPKLDAKGGEGLSLNYTKPEVTYKQQ